jgi:hypothetical protein
MKVAFDDDKGNHITIERKFPGVYRLYGTTSNSKWREWTATSTEIPNIEQFVGGFEALSGLMIEKIAGLQDNVPKGA